MPAGPTPAIVAFTMRHFILTNLGEPEARRRIDTENFAAPMLAPFVAWFAEAQNLVAGFTDAVLATVAPQGASTMRRTDSDRWMTHPRVTRATRNRRSTEVWVDEDGAGVAVFGNGVAGRLELAVEIDPDRRGAGLGPSLITGAVLTREPGTAVFAQISPGNVASLRAFLKAGFKPICAEVIFTPAEGATVPA